MFISVIRWMENQGRNCVNVKLDEGTKGQESCRVDGKKDMDGGL